MNNVLGYFRFFHFVWPNCALWTLNGAFIASEFTRHYTEGKEQQKSKIEIKTNEDLKK